MSKKVYIVMCYNSVIDVGEGVISGGEDASHIDTVWTSERKANKRCNYLNSEEMEEYREDYSYGKFFVECECLST